MKGIDPKQVDVVRVAYPHAEEDRYRRPIHP